MLYQAILSRGLFFGIWCAHYMTWNAHQNKCRIARGGIEQVIKEFMLVGGPGGSLL